MDATKPSEPDRWTQAELIEEATRRFGDEPKLWKFQCPNCGDCACAQDFKDAGVSAERVADVIGQECIGRHLGALSGAKPTTDSGRSLTPRGCDWCAYGLFRGPWVVVLPNGKEVRSFRLASADAALSTLGEDPHGDDS